MKKLVSVFLVLTVLLAGLAAFARADAPAVSEITKGEDNKVTVSVTGDNISHVSVSFDLDEYSSVSFMLEKNEETGLYEGTDAHLEAYPDAVISSVDITADYSDQHDEAAGKQTESYKAYRFDGNASLIQSEEDTKISQVTVSSDGKTQTSINQENFQYFDAKGTPTSTASSSRETVSARTEWIYQYEGSDEPTAITGWATTSLKEETANTIYDEDGKETSSRKTVDTYEVKLAKTPEGDGLEPFNPSQYREYQLVKGERTITEKGKTVNTYEGVRETTDSNLTTTYVMTEKDSDYQEGYKTAAEQETGRTGTVEETRKGTEKNDGDSTKTEVDEKTVSVYQDGMARTRSISKNNKTYDLESGALKRTVKQEDREEAKFTSFEYKGTYMDGSEYTGTASGYAATAYSGSTTTVDYENAKPKIIWEDRYDLTVRLKSDITWIPDEYADYYYEATAGTRTETAMGTDIYSSDADRVTDSKTETVYAGNNTRILTTTSDDQIVDKATGRLTRTEKRERQTESRYTEYSRKQEGQTVQDSTWADTKEIIRSTEVRYNSEGKKFEESETTSRSTFDFVESDSGEEGTTDFGKRIASQVTDSIDRDYYYSNGGIYCETASHTEWSLTGGGTRTEKESSERKDYDEAGDYTSKTIESSTTIREKGKDDDAVYSENWAVTSSDSVRKTYNRDGILTYEEVSRKKPGEEKSEENWYTDAGTLRNTQTTEKYEGKGVGTTVYQTINPATGQVTYERKTSQMKNDAGDWQYTYHYTYNNDNGTLRSKCIQNFGICKCLEQ